MDGCGHCTATLKNAKQIKDGKGKKRRFFHANTNTYNSLCKSYTINDELKRFLENTASKREVLRTHAFPTLFLVDAHSGDILDTTVGAPSIDDLKALINAAR